jgi:hypothetical protein
MRERGEDPMQHPVSVYLSGRSRYDLHARINYGNDSASAAAWLDTPKAVRFNLRRLDARRFARVHARKEAEADRGVPDHDASLDALQWGLVSVDGPDAPKIVGRGELTDRDVDTLIAAYGHGVCWAVGDAVYFASIPLTDDEKKAFAS